MDTYPFTNPPSYRMERNHTSLHLFNDLMRSIRNNDETILQANDISQLSLDNYGSHPGVHKYYYDHKHNGKLFVREKDTGELIPKDQSVLLSDGEFVRRDSTLLVDLTITTNRHLVKRALLNDRSAIDYCKGKYYSPVGLDTFVPLDISKFKLGVTLSNLNHIISESFQQFVALGVGTSGESSIDFTTGEGFTQAWYTNFVAYFNQTFVFRSFNDYLLIDPFELNRRETLVKIPDNSGIFPGWYLDVESPSLAERLVNENNNSFPSVCIGLNTASMRVDTQNHNSARLNIYYPNSISFNFPVGFYLHLTEAQARSTSTGRNKLTRNNEGALINYSAKVTDFKKSFLRLEEEEQSSLKPVFMGVELEIIPKGRERNSTGLSNIIRDIAQSEFGNHCIMKSDSSIGEYGFEIVTIPATMKKHKQMFQDHFFGGVNNFNKRLMVTERCGIHVHVSRNSFTKLSLGKFIAFINSPANQEFIVNMSNRTANRYCQRIPLKCENRFGIDRSATIARRVNMKGPNPSFERHVATNLRNTTETVEVRIFKATTSMNNLLRKLEFLEALVHFCKGHSLQQMTVYDFVEFVLSKENRKEYPYLMRWLGSKNYIEHKKLKVNGKKRMVEVYGKNNIAKPNNYYHKNLIKKLTTKQLRKLQKTATT